MRRHAGNGGGNYLIFFLLRLPQHRAPASSACWRAMPPSTRSTRRCPTRRRYTSAPVTATHPALQRWPGGVGRPFGEGGSAPASSLSACWWGPGLLMVSDEQELIRATSMSARRRRLCLCDPGADPRHSIRRRVFRSPEDRGVALVTNASRRALSRTASDWFLPGRDFHARLSGGLRVLAAVPAGEPVRRKKRAIPPAPRNEVVFPCLRSNDPGPARPRPAIASRRATRSSVDGALNSFISDRPDSGLTMNRCDVAGLASTAPRAAFQLHQRAGERQRLPHSSAPASAVLREREIQNWISIAAMGATMMVRRSRWRPRRAHRVAGVAAHAAEDGGPARVGEIGSRRRWSPPPWDQDVAVAHVPPTRGRAPPSSSLLSMRRCLGDATAHVTVAPGGECVRVSVGIRTPAA